MKRAKQIIAGFLAVYLLALLFMSCNDNCTTKEHTTPTSFQAAQEHHQQDKDICSPFCTCSCCSTSITVNYFAQSHFLPSVPKQKFPIYQETFISSSVSSIWQPPKIS